MNGITRIQFDPRHFILAAFVLLLWIPAPAGYAAGRVTKNVLFLGAGGEPPGETTTFDEYASIAGSFFNSPGWNRTVLYDGGHARSARRIDAAFGTSSKPFTSSNAMAAISNAEKLLATGKLASGDQYLLVINTHGNPVGKDTGTHSVLTSDQESFNLDRVKVLRDKFEKAGVKLAILDLSCFSGATQALASSKTCVISASDRDTVAFGSFGKEFFSRMKPGRSLEEVYLEARTNDTIGPAQPEISTEAGVRVAGILHPFSARLRYKGQDQKDFNPSDLLRHMSFSTVQCKMTSDHEEIRRLLKNLEDLESTGAKGARGFKRLGELYLDGMPPRASDLKTKNRPKRSIAQTVKDYEEALDDALVDFKAFQKAKNAISSKSEVFALQSKNGKQYRIRMKWEELLTMDYPRVISILEQKSSSLGSTEEGVALKAEVRLIQDAQAFAKKLIERDRLAQAFVEARQNYDESSGENLRVRATYVASAERDVYLKMYAKESNAAKQRPNPCKGFVL